MHYLQLNSFLFIIMKMNPRIILTTKQNQIKITDIISLRILLYLKYIQKKIVIKYFNEIDDDLIHSLLNYPFAILFSQRNNYVIHASSVLFKNKVFCFCGKSQAGKSSLASYLIKLGGSLISEDTCVFDYRDNKLLLLPSYNFIKISDEVNEYQNKTFKDPIKFFKKSTDRKGYLLRQ